MAARSKSATGPFVSKMEGTSGKHAVILEKNTKWIAPGHNSVVLDAVGQDWMVYHAIDPANRNGGRVMLIDKIIYQDGWPSIGNGTPSVDSMQAPDKR